MSDYKCQLLPENPIFRSRSEEPVWKALARRLRAGDVLLSGVHFSDHDGDSEVDFIVLLPEGFATIEVKGGRVWFADGSWQQATPEGVKPIDLNQQAIGHKNRVGKYLAARWGSGRPRMQHLVALPDTAVGPEDPCPGMPRALVIDKRQLDDAAGIVFDSLNIHMTNQPTKTPGAALVERAAELLAGRGDPQEQIAQRVSAASEQVERLTEQMAVLLDVMDANARVEISGGPGSGKTWLAVERARRLAEGGKDVGFLSYSRGLASYVQRVCRQWPVKIRNRVWVGTFHTLGHRWGVEIPKELARSDSAFWDEQFVPRMAQLAGHAHPRFDAIVVDEAQDFDDSWWSVLIAALRDESRGSLTVFSDDQQRIFDRSGAVLPGCVPMPIQRNMRNTRQVARVFQTLIEGRQQLLGLEGPPVRYIECASADAIGVADDAAVRLLEEGWQPQDIALLTTHHRHPVHAEQADADRDAYWEGLWANDDIFYCTVAGFKGLERAAVVLAVDGFRSDEVARQVLLVGLSRPRDLLVVCGDPDVLQQAGNRELVKRLRSG